MAFRVVMVKFIENITDTQVADFKEMIEELANNTPYVIQMSCGRHVNCNAEESLDAVAPNASFHDFMSVWEFKNKDDIEKFIKEPFHRVMAKSQFKKIVEHRHVTNI